METELIESQVGCIDCSKEYELEGEGEGRIAGFPSCASFVMPSFLRPFEILMCVNADQKIEGRERRDGESMIA